MAIFTIRQKQRFIGNVLVFLLIGGFIGAVWHGNPVAIAALVILLLLVGVAVFAVTRKGKRQVVPTAAPSSVTIDFEIPVMSNDTLESLTKRVQESYEARGGTISVAEAKAMARKGLSGLPAVTRPDSRT
jgi:predicted lipid-binding transport protein (Tim44 family)